ncbi:cytochrome c-type biogenesis protein CcmH, partial [bacterium]|nr:cytochrome c-type biogenesis protein CcmH [bacterium]
EYGEVVLAAPTKKGFNLTAWILPFVAILAGAGIVRAVVKRWTRPGAQPAHEPASEAEGDVEYRARVERELKDLDR